MILVFPRLLLFCLGKNTTKYKYILPHFPGMKDCFVFPFLHKPKSLCASFLPRPIHPPLPLYPAPRAGDVCVCVCVVQCAGREQLEHLQSSPLTAARHMAGPCEGWVLSPGKVLTHRQERRAALTPWGRGGNSWTSAPHSFILPPPPRPRREALEES